MVFLQKQIKCVFVLLAFLCTNSLYADSEVISLVANNEQQITPDIVSTYIENMKIRMNEDVMFTTLNKTATILLAHDNNTYDIQVNDEDEARTSIPRNQLFHKALQYDTPRVQHVALHQPFKEYDDLDEPAEDEDEVMPE